MTSTEREKKAEDRGVACVSRLEEEQEEEDKDAGVFTDLGDALSQVDIDGVPSLLGRLPVDLDVPSRR